MKELGSSKLTWSLFLQARMTCAPLLAKSSAVSYPIPELAPVIRTTLPVSFFLMVQIPMVSSLYSQMPRKMRMVRNVARATQFIKADNILAREKEIGNKNVFLTAYFIYNYDSVKPKQNKLYVTLRSPATSKTINLISSQQAAISRVAFKVNHATEVMHD